MRCVDVNALALHVAAGALREPQLPLRPSAKGPCRREPLPLLAELLRDAGYDAEHVRNLGMARAGDVTAVAQAESDGCILVTADTESSHYDCAR